MIEFLIDLRKKTLNSLTLYSPIAIIFIVYFLEIDIITFFAKISPILNEKIENNPTLGFTLNSALFVLIVNLIIDVFKHPSNISVNITNNSRRNDSYFNIRSSESHRPAIVHLDLKINNENQIIKFLVKKLGGFTMNCVYPHWIDCRIDNKHDLKKNALIVDQKGNFTIDINHALQERKRMSLYVKLALISNSFDINEGEIKVSIGLKEKGKIKRCLLYIIIILFFEIKISEYLIEARNDLR